MLNKSLQGQPTIMKEYGREEVDITVKRFAFDCTYHAAIFARAAYLFRPWGFETSRWRR